MDMLASRYWRTIESRGPTLEESRAILREEIAELYAARPIEQYTGETPDPIDVQYVMENTDLTRESAIAYLKYYKQDPVETVLFLVKSTIELPIPDFKGTPSSSEGYVSRSIRHRCTRGDSEEDGYDSA